MRKSKIVLIVPRMVVLRERERENSCDCTSEGSSEKE